jgi:response regulator of citrate/malate metabolism
MAEKILIVEDEMIVATDLRILLEKNNYAVTGIARSYEKAVELIRETKPDMVLLDIFLTGKLTGIDLAKKLKEDNIAFIYLSANANEEVLSAAKTTEPYGFIVKPFREKDLLVTLEIARYRHKNSVESAYRKEEDLQLQLENIFADASSWEQKLLKTGIAFQTYIPFDLFNAGFYDMSQNSLNSHSFLRIGFNEYQSIGMKELLTITGISIDRLISITSSEPKQLSAIIYEDDGFQKMLRQSPLKKLFAETFSMKSLMAMPLDLSGKPSFNFYFFSRRNDAYQSHHLHLLNHQKYILTALIEKAINSKIANNNNDSVNKNAQGITISKSTFFDNIIGNSHLLLNVFDQVMQVAPMNTSVRKISQMPCIIFHQEKQNLL